jgi:hypothetical protein
MQDHRAAFEADQDVFGATLDAEDGLMAYRCFEFGRNRPAQAAVADDDIDDAGADERGRNAASRGFYFRKFGQRGALSRTT